MARRILSDSGLPPAPCGCWLLSWRLLEALGGILEACRRYGGPLEASLETLGLTPGLFRQTLEDVGRYEGLLETS